MKNKVHPAFSSIEQDIIDINELVKEFNRDRFQERINAYVDSCPLPLANGGYKDTMTGEYIHGDDDE